VPRANACRRRPSADAGHAGNKLQSADEWCGQVCGTEADNTDNNGFSLPVATKVDLTAAVDAMQVKDLDSPNPRLSFVFRLPRNNRRLPFPVGREWGNRAAPLLQP
jgi:hypothetical protein